MLTVIAEIRHSSGQIIHRQAVLDQFRKITPRPVLREGLSRLCAAGGSRRFGVSFRPPLAGLICHGRAVGRRPS